MAITEPTTTRILRGVVTDHHRFTSVTDLPRVAAARPRQTGNHALDSIQSAAWDEGYANGRSLGAEHGFAEGFEQGLAEGRRAGHADGVATAQADALAEITTRVGSALTALEDAARALDRRDAVNLAEIEPVVVDLALSLAESILAREVSVASDPGREALCRALQLAPDHDHLVALLNPDDLAAIGAVADLAPGRALELVADPSVGRGGCVVEAGAARLDARIESALDRIREVLAP